MSNLQYDFNQFRVTIGQSNPELDAVLAEHGFSEWFILTAENPNGEEFPFFVNKQRTRVFEEQLVRLGVRFFKGVGQCNEPDIPNENAFLLVGITHEEAGALALQFDQHSFLTAHQGELPMIVQPQL